MSPRRRVTRVRRGGYEIRLPAEERQLLSSLPGQLERLLDAVKGGDEPPDGLRRLFPVAYARDPDAEAAFASLVGADLLDHHLEALAVLAQTAEATRLSEDEADAWLAALNDLRLVIGTTLDVDERETEIEEGDPRYPDWICYSYLSFLQGELVDALAGSLPPPTPGIDDDLPEDPWGELPGGLRWDGSERPDNR